MHLTSSATTPSRLSTTRSRPSLPGLAATMALALVLAACGGGGGDSGGSGSTPPSNTRAVGGVFYGPKGAQVTLQNNGGDDLTVALTTTSAYDSKTFSFATPLADGSAYAVTVRSAGTNLSCRAFRSASGTTPLADGALRVGCETVFDHIARGADGNPVSTYFQTFEAAIGGANGPVGTTATAYGEGRYVAFISDAAIGGSSGSARQVFLRDRSTGALTLVTRGAGGTGGNGNSFNVAISADGQTVVFDSYASDLVGGDSNGERDVFAYSVTDRTLTRLSVGPGGAQFALSSSLPSVSGDGRVVAYTTVRSNFTGAVAGSDNEEIVVRLNRASGATTAVSRNLSGLPAQGSRPAVSEDGNRIAFYSFASDLVPGDVNGLWDIFVADIAAGTMQRASVTSTGGERNQGSESASRVVWPAISGDGRWVAYATTASNVVPGDTNGGQDVFLFDTQTPRFTSSGWFVSFTGFDRAFYWPGD